MKVTTSESAVHSKSGGSQVRRRAIESKVSCGEKRTPEIRATGLTSAGPGERLAGASDISGLRSAAAPEVECCWEALPLEVVGNGEVVERERLPVAGECLELRRPRHREVALDLVDLERRRHAVVEFLLFRVQVALRELSPLLRRDDLSGRGVDGPSGGPDFHDDV